LAVVEWPVFGAARVAADDPKRRLSHRRGLRFGAFYGAESDMITFVAVHLFDRRCIVTNTSLIFFEMIRSDNLRTKNLCTEFIPQNEEENKNAPIENGNNILLYFNLFATKYYLQINNFY